MSDENDDKDNPRRKPFVPRPAEQRGNVVMSDFGFGKDRPHQYDIEDCRIDTLIELLQEAKKHYSGNACVSINNKRGARLYFTNISTHLDGTGPEVEW